VISDINELIKIFGKTPEVAKVCFIFSSMYDYAYKTNQQWYTVILYNHLQHGEKHFSIYISIL